jgi:hypothetical protein
VSRKLRYGRNRLPAVTRSQRETPEVMTAVTGVVCRLNGLDVELTAAFATLVTSGCSHRHSGARGLCGRRRRSRRQRSGVSGTTRSPPHRICSCRQQRPRGHDCIKPPVGDAGGHDGSEAVFQAQRSHRPIAFAAVARSAHEVMTASSPLWETPEVTTAAKRCFRHNAVTAPSYWLLSPAAPTRSCLHQDPCGRRRRSRRQRGGVSGTTQSSANVVLSGMQPC